MPGVHFMMIVLDEIALEGLDGITFPSLWKRLEHVKENFKIAIDCHSKNFIFQEILKNSDVDFFLLPEARPLISLTNRVDFIQEDDPNPASIKKESQEDISFNTVNSNGVRGSCIHFKSRKNLTENIRSSEVDLTYEHFMFSFGENNIVAVASQKKRSQAIFGHQVEKCYSLTEKEYAVMEMIGRSRYNGATTCGDGGFLSIFDAQQFWYLKKKLAGEELIRTQIYFVPGTGGRDRGSLMHLPRFYRDYPPPVVTHIESAVKFLYTQEEYRAVGAQVKQELNISTKMMKQMVRLGNHFITTTERPFTSMYPDLSPDDLLLRYSQLFNSSPSNCAGRLARNILVLTAIKPFTYTTFIADLDSSKMTSSGEAGDDEEVINGLPIMPDLNIDESILRQLTVLVGVEAQTRQQLARKTGLNLYLTRAAIRVLIRKKVFTAGLSTNSKSNDTYKYHLIADSLISPTSEVHKNTALNDNKGSVKVPHKSTVLNQTRRNRRRKFILDHLEEERVVTCVVSLKKMIIHEERGESNGVMDRKSFLRIIDELTINGQIMRYDIDVLDVKKQFICHRSIQRNDKLILERIEYEKTLASRRKSHKATGDKSTKAPTQESPVATIAAKPSPAKEMEKTKFVRSDQRLNYRYGYLPRMKRKQIIHEYLWYTVYGMDNKTEPLFPADDVTGTPAVYCDDWSWKRYVRPAITYPDFSQGWVLLDDIFLNIPIGILASVINIRFYLAEFETLLYEPRTRILPLFATGEKIKSAFLDTRLTCLQLAKFVGSLACYGLISVKAMPCSQAKNQMIFYLHKGSTLLDTRSSGYGYSVVTEKQYPEIAFHFTSALHVERYWQIMQEIACNTLLGRRVPDMKPICDQKPQRLHEPVKSSQDVEEMGQRIYDEMGACGLDSREYAHSNRAWSFHFLPIPSPINTMSKSSNIKKRTCPSLSSKPTNKMEESLVPVYNTLFDDFNVSSEIEELRKNAPLLPPIRSTEKKSVDTNKPEHTSNKKKSKIKELFADEIDKQILRDLQRKRANWSPKEDYLVILCKVASLIIVDKTARDSICLPWFHVRDVLRNYIPVDSSDKTSNACARRVNFLLKCKPLARTNATVLLTEALNDAALVKKYRIGIGNWNQLLRNHSEEAIKQFNSLVDLLISKFGMSPNDEANSFLSPLSLPFSSIAATVHCGERSVLALSLPDSLERIHELFTVKALVSAAPVRRAFFDCIDEGSITVMMLYNVILGSFRIGVDNSIMEKHLTRSILNQYPQNLILKAIEFMQGNRVVTRPKCGDSKDNNKIIGPMRLKLTRAYEQHCLSDLVNYTRHILESGRNLHEIIDSNISFLGLKSVSTGALASVILDFLHDEKSTETTLEFSERNISYNNKGGTSETFVDAKSGMCSRGSVLKNVLGFSFTEKRVDNNIRIDEGLITIRLDLPVLANRWIQLTDHWRQLYARLTETFPDKKFCSCVYPLEQEAGTNRLVDSVLLRSLKVFIDGGDSPGRTRLDIELQFGDVVKTSRALEHLLHLGEVRELGATVPRFVGRSHLRLWLFRSYSAAPVGSNGTTFNNTNDNATSDLVPVLGDKRPSTSNLDGEPDFKKFKNSQNDVFFLPEPWISVSGQFQSPVFKVITETLYTRIAHKPGLTLDRLIAANKSFHLPRTIRVIVRFLSDVGAIQVIRSVTKGKCGLFSNRQTRIRSDNILFGNDDELGLVPIPGGVTKLGGFMRYLLLETKEMKDFDYSSVESQLCNNSS